MTRTFKDDIIYGFKVKYIDEGHGMIFAQVSKLTTQYLGYGKNKTEAKEMVTDYLRKYKKRKIHSRNN